VPVWTNLGSAGVRETQHSGCGVYRRRAGRYRPSDYGPRLDRSLRVSRGRPEVEQRATRLIA